MVRPAGAVRIGELGSSRLADAAALMAVEHRGAGLVAETGFGDDVVCRRSLTEARRQGHQQISVDFDSGNPVSRPFWLGDPPQFAAVWSSIALRSPEPSADRPTLRLRDDQ